MKRVLFFVVVLIFSVNLNAQKLVPATSEQKQLMLERITASSANMQSLICHFEQVKELSILNEKMVSKGIMYYRKDNCLRWEYTSPSSYIFIVNNKKIVMKTENSRKDVINVRASRFFQEIIKIMTGINVSGFKDMKDFTVTYYWSENQWLVRLVPLQKKMRKIFSDVQLTFNGEDYTVEKVEMKEPNGDTTTILFSKKQFNSKIGNEMFIVN